MAHAGDDTGPILEACERDGVVDCRSLNFDEQTFADLRNWWLGRKAKWMVLFEDAKFPFRVNLDGLIFGANSRLDSATFEGGATLNATRFESGCTFRGTRFLKRVEMRSTSFETGCEFHDTIFAQGIFSKRSSFESDIAFIGVTFGSNCYFRLTRFSGRLTFNRCDFGSGLFVSADCYIGRSLTIANSKASGDLRISSPAVVGDIDIRSCEFDDVALGLRTNGSTSVRQVRFSRFSSIELQSEVIDFDRVELVGGGTIRVSPCKLSFKQSTFVRPVLIVGQPATSVPEGALQSNAALPKRPTASEAATKVNLTEVSSTDLSNLTLANVDLSEARLGQGHNVSSLKVNPASFAKSQGRRLIREELDLRNPQDLDSDSYRERAGSAAETYRALRLAREGAGDEPGAADFYYGEMEMRRRALPPLHPERAVLALYWVSSGYGLRASRAILCLLAVLAMATAGFVTVGFAPASTSTYVSSPLRGGGFMTDMHPRLGAQPGFREGALYSVTSATALLRPVSPVPLTKAGEAIEVLLRLAGPIFLGLAVLSIRNRVKR